MKRIAWHPKQKLEVGVKRNTLIIVGCSLVWAIAFTLVLTYEVSFQSGVEYRDSTDQLKQMIQDRDSMIESYESVVKSSMTNCKEDWSTRPVHVVCIEQIPHSLIYTIPTYTTPTR
jgi:hypothetical protein